jgi:hypothetical protein
MSAPIIISIEWGNIRVKQGHATKDFKDVVLEPNGFYEWDFKAGFNLKFDEKHTSHQYKKNMSKGIQPHSVRDLLNKGSVFVLTTGYHDDLGVNKNTVKFLKDQGKQVIVVNTSDVADTYNDLVGKGSKVVALVHSTC